LRGLTQIDIINISTCNPGYSGLLFLKMTKKQQFLEDHNKLSPLNLQATASLLSRFRIEKTLLFKDNNWSIDKLRRPFILWLSSLPIGKKESIEREEI